ncbi:unnamed protein product [Protopolystoma xenopodis]|uniref:Uncharacterized protein n=1 Tax=Protopolystoma xenopodis TaxID=117903 RepID=A0A3S5BFW9_9PLAT|nr:unnamed protein product [Protopolystoma xenopodis]
MPNVRRWMAVSVSNASQPPAAWRVAYPPNGQSTGRGFRSSEHAVFLYNSSQLQLLLSMPELLEPKGKDSLFARNPCLSECQVGSYFLHILFFPDFHFP